MKLRIIERIDKHGCELILEHQQNIETIQIESIDSPFTKNFKKNLEHYYAGHAFFSNEKNIEKNIQFISEIATKSIRKGQYLGDCLLDDEQILYRWIKKIEQLPLTQLQVHIESDKESFFDEIWELLVLPDSSFCLSAAAGSFIRKIGQSIQWPTVDLDLQVSKKSDSEMAVILEKMQNSQFSKQKSDINEEQPLTILHLLARNCFNKEEKKEERATNKIHDYPSYAYTYYTLLNKNNALNYRVKNIKDLPQFESQLSLLKPHIVHLDCPVLINEETDQVELLLEITSNVEVKTINIVVFCQRLVAYNVHLLTINCRYFSDSFDNYSATKGLAKLAKHSSNYGIGNIIGTSHHADGWLTAQCFTDFYQALTQGLTVAQAVVESRKMRQTSLQISRFTPQPIAFQSWTLLQHYGGQSVRFFRHAHLQKKNDANSENQSIKKMQTIMHGFDSQLLPPESITVNDACLPAVIPILELGGKILLSGSQGIGKSHLAHQLSYYLAQSNVVQHCFYFDFRKLFYQPEIMLQMIAPVFDLSSHQSKEVEQILAEKQCLFINDNLFANKITTSKEVKEFRNLIDFLNSLVGQGQLLLATGEHTKQAKEVGFQNFEIPSLTIQESAILTANIALDHHVNNDDFFQHLAILHRHTQGNPYLMKQAWFWYDIQDIESLEQRFTNYAVKQHDHEPVTHFIEAQFNAIPPYWRAILLLASEIEGLLLALLMIASESTNDENLWKKFLSLFPTDLQSQQYQDFKWTLGVLEKRGLICQQAQGKVLTEQAERYLCRLNINKILDVYDVQAIRNSFSQLFCAGICIISNYFTQQQNPTLLHYLLMNRRYYTKFFEQLWFDKNYSEFIKIKISFEKLLEQVGLIHEIAEWALDLLGRSPSIAVSGGILNTDNVMSHSAYLHLANSALALEKALQNSEIQIAAKYWYQWVLQQQKIKNNEINKIDIVLFHQVTNFLQMYYLKAKKWKKCIDVMEFAHIIYHSKEAWHWDIHVLKVATKCYANSDRPEQALMMEKKILQDIPYENAPDGFWVRQAMDVLLARIDRQETEAAQILLDELKSSSKAEKIAEELNDSQNEIDFLKQNYTHVLPYYCHVWQRSLLLNNPIQLNKIKARFVEMTVHLGETICRAKFNAICEPDTVYPLDYTGDIKQPSILH